jgi:uncharacterized protein (TIGR04255 family)
MTWRLPESRWQVYPRNPLQAVVTQLRFDPILNIGAKVAQFQDLVRARFSLYEEHENQLLQLQVPTGTVETRAVKQHRFMARETPATTILDDQSVAIEFKAHRTRDELQRDAKLVFGALHDVYAPITATRFGLRYINVIDKGRISTDLGRAVGWRDLIAPEFLTFPAGIADLADTRFRMELASTMPLGSMTLRYGLLPVASGDIAYLFDVDRFREGSVSLAEVECDLPVFAEDIFRAFCVVRGPTLAEWMEKA